MSSGFPNQRIATPSQFRKSVSASGQDVRKSVLVREDESSGSGAFAEREGSVRKSYLSELRNFIEQNKYYPPQAKTLGHEGLVEVRFTILSDGTLTAVELLRSSGSKILDIAAVDLIRKIQKLNPIPEELAVSRFELILPIEYLL